MVADRYDVDSAYFAEKYSMPVGERRNNMPIMEPQSDPDDTKGKADDKKKQQKNVYPFFD